MPSALWTALLAFCVRGTAGTAASCIPPAAGQAAACDARDATRGAKDAALLQRSGRARLAVREDRAEGTDAGLSISDAACSVAGADPYTTGVLIPCCEGTAQTIGQWDASRRWYYLCVATPMYYPHFDTTEDYLGIGSTARGVGSNGGSIGDNFYLVIADWGGCAGSCQSCCTRQKQVAQKMQQYVNNRKRDRPSSQLLFVLAGGDNFYWTGVSTGLFGSAWRDVYGPVLTGVPWFAVMGNHDHGDVDFGGTCPDRRPRFVCNASNANDVACGGTKPYSTRPQAYDSNQLDANKGGVDGPVRANYHMPDYTYYYTIPQLDFELIAVDWNAYNVDILGGGGANGGAKKAFSHCGGHNNIRRSLSAIRDASTKILKERAAASNGSGNVAILNHYPDNRLGGQNLRSIFLAGLTPERKNATKVLSFYGHDHRQVCIRRSADGACVDFLTGGGGGCCGAGDTPAGFVSISFDASKKQVVECFAPSPNCTLTAWGFERSAVQEVDPGLHTADHPPCPNYNSGESRGEATGQ